MITTTKSQSLIARVRNVLAAGGDDAAAPQTAEEFAELCRDAAARLRECEGMAEPENVVVKAEEEPALIETLEALAKFQHAGQWAACCENHSLPVAPKVDTGAASWLLEHYKKWRGAPDFLWKKYRDAVLRKDEGLALAVARRIIKVKPSDRAAREETNRMLRRHFRAKLRELDELVECDDRKAALELADHLDRLPFDELKKGKSWDAAVQWRNAKRRETDEKRVGALVAGLGAQRETGDLKGAKGACREARSLAKTHDFKLDENALSTLAKTEEWVKEEEAKRKREAGAKEVVDRCTKELSRIDANISVLMSSPLAELEGARRKLSNCWREVEKIGGGAGAGLSEQVAARLQQLDSFVAKTRRRRRRKARLIIGTVSLVAFSVAYYFYAQWRGAWMVDRFTRLKSERKAIPLDKLVKSTNTYRWPIARLARLDIQIGHARSWLDREYGHRDAVESTIGGLKKESADGFPRPIAQYWSEFGGIDENIGLAANDLQPMLKESLAPLTRQWDAHVDAYVAETRARRAQILDETSKILSGAPRLDLAARDDARMERVKNATVELAAAMETAIPPAAPLQEVKLEAIKLEPELTALRKHMESFREILADTERAGTYDDFISTMQRFRDGPFEATPEGDAAKDLMLVAKTKSQLVGSIFAPGDERGWAFFEANRNKDELFPAEVEEKERFVLDALSTDETLENLYWCRFTETKGGKTFVRYCKGPTKRRDRKVGNTSIIDHSGMFYSRGSFLAEKYETKNGVGTRLVSEGTSAETKLFLKIRPNDRLLSGSQQYYRSSLFSSFDDILSAGDAHPLYKTYLHFELGDVITKRPHEWGTMFAPQLLRDLETVRANRPALLITSDWMWPGKYAEQEQATREFYAARRGHSYALEAKVNRRLVESALSTGFGYAGHTDIGGKLSVRPNAASEQVLYGSPRPGAPAKIVFRRSGEAAAGNAGADLFDDAPAPGWQALESVAPFTPLLHFKGDLDELLASVATEVGISVDSVRALALPAFLTAQPTEDEAAAGEPAATTEEF